MTGFLDYLATSQVKYLSAIMFTLRPILKELLYYMKNVYDEVRLFYEEDVDWEPIIRREWVDGFLRQKAWQGINDDDLREIWHNLEMFILYLIHSESDNLEELTLPEYSLAIEWMAGHIPDFTVAVKPVKDFFNVLKEFYQYLYAKKVISGFGVLCRAAEEIVGGNEVKLLSHNCSVQEIGLFDDFDNTVMTEDLGERVGQTVEKLMVKIGSFFQQDAFCNDFDRALYLYTGPFDTVPEDEQDEFWLGFWDYFLFDYHLLTTDTTPLAHFYQEQCSELNLDERQILEDLLNAKFTVFYISKVMNQDWVECINLFTGEILQLPYPDFQFNNLKRLLFYGHIYACGVVMLNYVTSIEVSPNLRQRIKDEVVRQKAIYEIQKPGATIADFFDRHALVVRHTIDVLVTLAKVNVTSAYQIERDFPKIQENCKPNIQVTDLLVTLAQEYGYSLYDIDLVKKMWHDFCQLSTVIVRKPATWAAAILYAFSQVNGTNDIIPEEIADNVGISVTSLKSNRARIYEALQLQKFDPRYLSEEGFVLSLFVL